MNEKLIKWVAHDAVISVPMIISLEQSFPSDMNR